MSSNAGADPAGRATAWGIVRMAGGSLILAVLAWRLGAGPFLDGIRAVSGRAVVLATVIGALTTLSCAWRWHLIAVHIGARLPLRDAVASYYQAQFLNVTLPGGVLGDVQRAVRHGAAIGDVGLGIRAAVWDRVSGQAVQAVVALVILSLFASPVRAYLPAIAAVAVAAVVLAAIGVVVGLLGPSRRGRRWTGVLARLRPRRLSGRLWIGVVAASLVMSIGQLVVFLVAADAAGIGTPIITAIPLVLLSLLAMLVPLNIAGWGPREGVAAWAFAAGGLGAADGVAAAATYGILGLVASLPGAAVLGSRWWRARWSPSTTRSGVPGAAPVPALGQAGRHG